ncbi:hypothetical protein [Rothia sp. HMSC065B04]|uniref:hypothetical protein n=1 Tax=Rothia sp. HMSC065B04 TaxID=1739349 RepID=UPI00114C9634|nr:hypothetical protein [Rothia sp. HMSC065B04]
MGHRQLAREGSLRSGDLILDYPTPHGESGSFTLTQDQQLNTRRARSEADIEAYDKTREET